jgi:hypothetical protein
MIINQLGWATNIAGTGTDTGNAIAVDNNGNVYVIGVYNSSSLRINSFLSGGGAINVSSFGTLSNSGTNDVFVVKYNTNGQALWATSIGGTNGDSGNAIAVDNNGNVYVTGNYFSSPLTINSFSSVTGGVINLSSYGTLANSGSSDTFIVKYNTNGQALWATSIGGFGSDTGSGIAVDNNGNVYVIGVYNSSITINSFSAVTGGVINVSSYGTLTGTGFNDVFVVKYNTNGQALWAINIIGNLINNGNGIAVDNNGNVYITGWYSSSSLTINSFSSVTGGTINLSSYGTLANSGSSDALIVKYNTNGQALWATSIGGSSSDSGNEIAVDTSGNVYATGIYSSSPLTINSFSSVTGATINLSSYGTLANSGSTDFFVVKYNTNGLVQWATSIGGSSNNDFGNGIATDTSGNVYVTGYYGSSLTINSFSSVTGGVINLLSYGTLANSGLNDVVIVKYNTNGLVQWATSIAGSSTDNGNGIAVDTSGNVYVTGIYSSSPLTINSFSSVTGGVINVSSYGTLANSGSTDVFVVKYNTNGQIL